jgi:predicted nucleotidyltransferase
MSELAPPAIGLSAAELARRADMYRLAIVRYESTLASRKVATRVLGAAPGTGLPSDRMRRLLDARDAIERAARRAGVSNVRVFGSVARGEDRPDSDVDLLVDFDLRAHGAAPLISLQRELDQLLDERVDLATVELLRPDVAARAIAEAVPL